MARRSPRDAAREFPGMRIREAGRRRDIAEGKLFAPEEIFPWLSINFPLGNWATGSPRMSSLSLPVGNRTTRERTFAFILLLPRLRFNSIVNSSIGQVFVYLFN